jgi:hypothetical protein
LALFVQDRLDLVVFDQGVLALDVVKVADDGLRGMDIALVPEVPLEGADPLDNPFGRPYAIDGGAGDAPPAYLVMDLTSRILQKTICAQAESYVTCPQEIVT